MAKRSQEQTCKHDPAAPQQNIAKTNPIVSVTLDEVTQKYIDDARRESEQMIEAECARIRRAIASTFDLKIEAVVQLFIRAQKLEGNWRLSEDGKYITKEE